EDRRARGIFHVLYGRLWERLAFLLWGPGVLYDRQDRVRRRGGDHQRSRAHPKRLHRDLQGPRDLPPKPEAGGAVSPAPESVRFGGLMRELFALPVRSLYRDSVTCS